MSAPPVLPAPGSNEAYILDAPDGVRPFDAIALETDLRNMWKRVGGDPAPKGGAVYRAALANLIVPMDPAREDKLMPVLVDVTRSHPARLFTIEAGSAARGSGLRARVGALCHRRESGGGLVCCEQVVVESDEESTALIPSAIRSLLIGDLPTVLLDFHPGLGVPWISELMKMADLVLEDSCLKQSGKETEVWHFLKREGSGRVHDLAWARLTPWREILAELFDEKEYLPALGTIRKIEMGFTGEGYPPPPVWLLAGWLASRLRWTPQGGNRNGITLRSAGGTVTLVMGGLGTGDGRVLERIAIRSDEPHPLDLEITHHGHDSTAMITAGATRREVPFGYREFAACIVSEIHRHAENRPLEDAARVAEDLMRHWRDT